MALLQCTYKSAVLGGDTNFNVIVPDRIESARVLYLLHGIAGNHTTWSRLSSIERYAMSHNYFVVMPNGARSFYSDMENGPAYYSHITQELMDYVGRVFNVNQARENTFIAGLSMGGYGAFKIALQNPDKFCAAASFSGVLDVALQFENRPEWQKEVSLICGNKSIRGSENDLLFLLDRYSDGNLKRPRLYQACGTEDFLYNDNQTFRSKVETMGFDYKYEEGPGEHNWDFWDEYIKHALNFFDEK